MQYKAYGKTGDKVSVLGFGAMRFPKVKGRVDSDLFVEMLKLAFDMGINYAGE
ncbi:hypothetical protein C5S53_15020 [Methanophagales archaeon]|nr:hypothetical protein C5S53_15020 [Methanophagales archaeon]